MSREYAPHPYSEIFPIRADSSLTELSDSMKAHGQLEDIVIFEDKILDGRRRQLACIRAAIKPRYRMFGSREGDGADALEFSFQTNIKRRDLSKGEREIAAAGYAKLKKGESNQHTKKEVGPKGPTTVAGQKEAAQKFGVPVRQVKKAKAVLEKGTPELVEAMRAGTVTVTAAAGIVNEPADVQNQALADVETGKAKTLAAAIAATRPAPPADKGKVARGVAKLADELATVETAKTELRDTMVGNLRKMAEVIENRLG